MTRMKEKKKIKVKTKLDLARNEFLGIGEKLKNETVKPKEIKAVSKKLRKAIRSYRKSI